MKVYTKKGDEGKTGLIGGTRVDKNHVRIESYGTVDELNSWVGVLRDHASETHAEALIKIQNELFTLGSLLAADPEKNKMKLPELSEADILWLEKEMDRFNETLPEMKNFVLPGGHVLISYCHVARCVCRRAERLVVSLNQISAVSPVALKYLNRLSDYFFVLSRQFSNELNAQEIPWKPSL